MQIEELLRLVMALEELNLLSFHVAPLISKGMCPASGRWSSGTAVLIATAAPEDTASRQTGNYYDSREERAV